MKENLQHRLLDLHKRHSWLPFTQMQLEIDPAIIAQADGLTLYTVPGSPYPEQIIDAIGSWWTSVLGHRNPQITAAVHRQLDRLEHCIYTGAVHQPGLELSAALSELTGGRLPRSFFSDNGSTAVEVGCKMAFQYFANRGEEHKQRFAVLEHGYHGDTIGTMAIGARSVFHELYKPLLFDVERLPSPVIPFAKWGTPEEEPAMRLALEAMELLFERIGDQLCAVVLEPVLQGAGGMLLYPPRYLQHLRRLCDDYRVLWVSDEVFSGAGRTGPWFASEHAGVWPDVIALAKGLTGGYLPLAVTLATEEIYSAFLSEDRTRTLFHGHSMTGSALGCAAALAAIEQTCSPQLRSQVTELERWHSEELAQIAAGPLARAGKLVEVRNLGSVGMVELALGESYTGSFAWRFRAEALRRGVLLRPLGSTIYVSSAYTASREELSIIYATMASILKELLL